jgi:hypothetical protein
MLACATPSYSSIQNLRKNYPTCEARNFCSSSDDDAHLAGQHASELLSFATRSEPWTSLRMRYSISVKMNLSLRTELRTHAATAAESMVLVSGSTL